MLRDLATKCGETRSAEVFAGERGVDLSFVPVADVGTGGMAITKVRDFRRQKGCIEADHGGSFGITVLPKVKLEVVVSENNSTRLTEIASGALSLDRVLSGSQEGTNELCSVSHKNNPSDYQAVRWPA